MNPQYYLDKYFVQPRDLELLKQIQDKIDMPWITHNFFDWVIQRYPDLIQELLDEEIRESIEKSHRVHWLSLFSGIVDEKFIRKRIELGVRNANPASGMDFDIYFEGTAKIYDLFQVNFLEKGISNRDTLVAFDRMFKMEVFIVTTSQSNENQKTLQEQNEALKELSAPIARLQKALLFLPLVGFIDSKRARDLMNTMLEKIATTQSKVFIIDIAGIGVMDTAVANYLIKITKATSLMGCQTILSGLSSTVAQTIVELGIDIGGLLTTGNLEDALNKGLALIGAEIIHK